MRSETIFTNPLWEFWVRAEQTIIALPQPPTTPLLSLPATIRMRPPGMTPGARSTRARLVQRTRIAEIHWAAVPEVILLLHQPDIGATCFPGSRMRWIME